MALELSSEEAFDPILPGIYELNAHNRVFKTGFMAWTGYRFLINEINNLRKQGFDLRTAVGIAKKHILVNCPYWTDQPCIVNYPHTHYYPFDLYKMHPINSFVMTDQGEQFMDARKCSTDEIIDMSYWNYQAMKQGDSWSFDTVRHKNIDPRIRLNPTFYIKLFRIPPNFNYQLQAVKVKAYPNDDSGRKIIFYILNPQRFYPLWDHKVKVERKPNFKVDERGIARSLIQ